MCRMKYLPDTRCGLTRANTAPQCQVFVGTKKRRKKGNPARADLISSQTPCGQITMKLRSAFIGARNTLRQFQGTPLLRQLLAIVSRKPVQDICAQLPGNCDRCVACAVEGVSWKQLKCRCFDPLKGLTGSHVVSVYRMPYSADQSIAIPLLQFTIKRPTHSKIKQDRDL